MKVTVSFRKMRNLFGYLFGFSSRCALHHRSGKATISKLEMFGNDIGCIVLSAQGGANRIVVNPEQLPHLRAALEAAEKQAAQARKPKRKAKEK